MIQNCHFKYSCFLNIKIPSSISSAVVITKLTKLPLLMAFLNFNPRKIIEIGNVIKNNPDAIEKYYNADDTSFMSEWDGVHQRLRCCGFVSYLDHVNHYKPRGITTCVPESCCIEQTAESTCASKVDIVNDCPKLTKRTGTDPWTYIYVQGCLEILGNVYERELKTQLLIFGLFDVLVVLFEIISCALAAAYVAQVIEMLHDIEWPFNIPPPNMLTTSHLAI